MSLSLTRRRTLLELLADACERGAHGRLRVRLPDSSLRTARIRFLALSEDALCFQWPGQQVTAALNRGTPVEVRFTHKGSRYAFQAQVRGRVPRRLPGRGYVSALKVTLPLRLEREEQRAYFRYALPDTAGPVQAVFTDVRRRDICFTVRLTNVSYGGLGAETSDPLARQLSAGDLLWARLQLSEENKHVEFVVRLAHVQARGEPGHECIRLGCVFCAGDDPAQYEENLRRLERFVIEHRQAVWRRATEPAAGRR